MIRIGTVVLDETSKNENYPESEYKPNEETGYEERKVLCKVYNIDTKEYLQKSGENNNSGISLVDSMCHKVIVFFCKDKHEQREIKN